MSMGMGGEAFVDPETARRESWPTLRQFCIFMENRVGQLHELLRHIEQHDLRVIALSIVDSVDCAIARVMVDKTDRGREIFRMAGFQFSESDLIGVALPDDPQPYVKICMAMLQAEVNIHYTYPLLYRAHGRGAIALYVDDVDLGLRVLREKDHEIITESDIESDDGYL